MDKPRFCPLDAAGKATFDGAEHEDKKPGFDNIEVYDCPKCGGQHRYHNGRVTLAPVTFECLYCGDEIEEMMNGGGHSYCDRSCQRRGMREAKKKLDEMLEEKAR